MECNGEFLRDYGTSVVGLVLKLLGICRDIIKKRAGAIREKYSGNTS